MDHTYEDLANKDLSKLIKMAKKKKKTTIKTPGLKFKGFKKGGVTRKKYNKGGVVKPFDHYKASGL